MSLFRLLVICSLLERFETIFSTSIKLSLGGISVTTNFNEGGAVFL